MRQLRRMPERGEDSITLLLGIFSGASMTPLVGLLVLLSTHKYRAVRGHEQMETDLPVSRI